MTKEVEELFKKAKEYLSRFTPEERQALIERQKAKFIRGEVPKEGDTDGTE